MCFRKDFEILQFVKKHGIPRWQIEEIKEEFADRKPQEGMNYYYYVGPDDEKTRAFCKQMLKYDKVVSELDIEILSNYLNYDVKEYKGSYNCRHKWVSFRGKRISTPELTVRQIKRLRDLGIKG